MDYFLNPESEYKVPAQTHPSVGGPWGHSINTSPSKDALEVSIKELTRQKGVLESDVYWLEKDIKRLKDEKEEVMQDIAKLKNEDSYTEKYFALQTEHERLLYRLRDLVEDYS